MKGKMFYEKRTLKKFRTVFESAHIIVGADRKNKYRTFRKDTGLIAFTRREALEMKIQELTGNQSKEAAEKNENSSLGRFGGSRLGFNCP